MADTWQDRIKWCEDAGMSRGEIAEHCGFVYSTLSDIANGATAEPNGMRAVRLFALSEKHRPAPAAPRRRRAA